MSVSRKLNIISQMRIDVPHVRLIESGVAGDFDTVVGRSMAGEKGLILRGFTMIGSAGVQANTLLLSVSDGIAINLNASESGSILWIPPSRASELLDGATNGAVEGSFVSSAVNYVGIDFLRELDDSTVDLVKFKDPVTGAESDRLVPLGDVLDYKIIISTSPFSTQTNVIPVAKVTVSSTGAATEITDARQMMFRLGSGGDIPNTQSSFTWPAGRAEGAFSGGDKSLTSQKQWSDAVMTRLWELGGGANWFAPTADRNVQMTNYGAPFSTGDYFTFDSGTGGTAWTGIRFLFDGGTGSATINEVIGGIATVADGQCVYVDLDRTTNRTIAGANHLVAQVASLSNIGTSSTPGARWILAWRVGTELFQRNWRYPVGTTFTPATTSALGVVKLNQTPASALLPTVVSIMANGRIEVTATAGNTTAATFTGFGTGSGVVANAGATGGWGGYFVAGPGSEGIRAFGGTGSDGVYALGEGAGVGVFGEGGASGEGVIGTGHGGAAGGFFTGGATNGNGVTANANAGAAAGIGIVGTGAGTGAGGSFTGGATGTGVVTIGGASGGVGIVSTGVLGANGGTLLGGTGTVTGGTGLNTTGGAGSATGGNGTYSQGGNGPTLGGDGVYGGGGSGIDGGNGLTSLGGPGTTNGGHGLNAFGGAGAAGIGGYGVRATGGAGVAGGAGVIGMGGGPAASGVIGVAASATSYGLLSNAGYVGCVPTGKFKFSATKTGVIIIPAVNFSAVGVASDAYVANGLYPLPSFGAMNTPSWTQGTVAVSSFLAAGINIPRGATITGCELWIKNLGANAWGAGGTFIMKHHSYATPPTAVDILNTTINSAGVGFDGWLGLAAAPTASALENGVTGAGGSGWVTVEMQFPATVSGFINFGGLRITYDYTDVDFMV